MSLETDQPPPQLPPAIPAVGDAAGVAAGASGPEMVTTDRRCIRCGYSLVGLSKQGLCPECGTPVAHSLRLNLLAHSDPGFVSQLQRGVRLSLWSSGVMFASVMMFWFGSLALTIMLGPGMKQTSWLALQLLMLIAAATGILGWWLVSTPETAQQESDRGDGPRSLVRYAHILWVVLAAVAAMMSMASAAIASAPTRPMPLASGGVEFAAMIGAMAAAVLSYIGHMAYLRWLARRIPDERTRQMASILMWLGPLISLLGCFCLSVGALVALGMEFFLLMRVRGLLGAIQAQMSRMPANQSQTARDASRDHSASESIQGQSVSESPPDSGPPAST